MVRTNWRSIAAAFGAVGALAACTTPPARPQAMTAADTPAPKPNWVVRRAIAIGNVTEASGHSVVTAGAFRRALEQSLATADYLVHSPTAHYRLDASLQELDRPQFTLTKNVTVTSMVLYRLTGHGTNAQYSVTTTATATFDDAAIFGKRLQLASERALHANIETLLDKLQKF